MALMDLPSQDGWQWALAPLAGWPEAVARPRPLTYLQQLVSRFLVWRARRETLRLLARVDAATLRDLGITDIESAVYGDPRDRMRPYDVNWRSAKR
ncbi:MAG: DUF1127 domain-containing protein [Alphaproteobacteria bacterium]